MAKAGDFMSRDLVLLAPELSVHRAMGVLLENGISGAPVVDPHGDVVGMLTERDCLVAIYRASYHQDPGGTVAAYMTREVRTVDVEADLLDVIELFLRHPYRRFPVLAGTRLVGLVSRRDILRAVEGLWSGGAADAPPKRGGDRPGTAR